MNLKKTKFMKRTKNEENLQVQLFIADTEIDKLDKYILEYGN